MVNGITQSQRPFIQFIGVSMCINLSPSPTYFNIKDRIAITLYRSLPIPTAFRAYEFGFKTAYRILWFRSPHKNTIPLTIRNCKPEYLG